MLSTQKQIKPGVLSMGSEEVAGIGNGPGSMDQDSASLSSTPKTTLFKSKDGLDSTLVHYITNHKTSYSSTVKYIQLKDLSTRLTQISQLIEISHSRNYLFYIVPLTHKFK